MLGESQQGDHKGRPYLGLAVCPRHRGWRAGRPQGSPLPWLGGLPSAAMSAISYKKGLPSGTLSLARRREMRAGVAEVAAVAADTAQEGEAEEDHQEQRQQ